MYSCTVHLFASVSVMSRPLALPIKSAMSANVWSWRKFWRSCMKQEKCYAYPLTALDVAIGSAGRCRSPIPPSSHSDIDRHKLLAELQKWYLVAADIFKMVMLCRKLLIQVVVAGFKALLFLEHAPNLLGKIRQLQFSLLLLSLQPRNCDALPSI